MISLEKKAKGRDAMPRTRSEQGSGEIIKTTANFIDRLGAFLISPKWDHLVILGQRGEILPDISAALAVDA